jgi:hypothetical protein
LKKWLTSLLKKNFSFRFQRNDCCWKIDRANWCYRWKIEIGGFEILEGAFVGSYVHVNKIAALTAISAAVPNAEVY